MNDKLDRQRLTGLRPDGPARPLLSWGMIGLSLTVVLLSAGLLTGVWRWALYALMALAGMVWVALGLLQFPLLMAALGVAMFAAGLAIAARFMATHPRLQV